MVTKLQTAIGRVSPRARKNASQLNAMCPSAAMSPKAAMIPIAHCQLVADAEVHEVGREQRHAIPNGMPHISARRLDFTNDSKAGRCESLTRRWPE